MSDLIEREYGTKRLENEYCKTCTRRGKYEIFGAACTPCWVMDCIEEFENAPAVNRWISVEDALPEIGCNVLVTRQTESNARYIRIEYRQDDCWMDSTDEYGKPNPHPVIAWMPMPDAYKPPEKE